MEGRFDGTLDAMGLSVGSMLLVESRFSQKRRREA